LLCGEDFGTCCDKAVVLAGIDFLRVTYCLTGKDSRNFKGPFLTVETANIFGGYK
jgi:hypothetical protein